MARMNLKVFRNWEFFVIIGLPLLLMPLLWIPDDDIIGTGDKARPSTKFKCAFVLIIMAVYWMVEALPLAITSLLPMVLLPLLGVQDTAKVSINYMKETNMMFVGGLIIALAVEYCNLHRRIALKVMTTVGCAPIRLMFGVMLTTMFLSMWMSNTATAAMVVPIAMAVIEELYPKPEEDHGHLRRRPSMFKERSEVDFEAFLAKHKARKARQQQLINAGHPPLPEPNDEASKYLEMDARPGRRWWKEIKMSYNFVKTTRLELEEEDTDGDAIKRTNLKKMLLFSICLSSNIGGTGVITGTASNLVFQELIKPVNVGQNGKYMDISFATWIAYNLPPMLINVGISWIYLVIVYFGVPDWLLFWRKRKSHLDNEEETQALNRVHRHLEEKKQALGKMTFHELAVFILFILIVLLWLLREPKFMPGWAEHVSDADVGDSTAALFVVLLLFIIPRNLETFFGVGEGKTNTVKTPPLLDWKYIQLNLPWGVIILMGGGFALSNAVVYSGLSEWLGRQLNAVETLPTVVILVVCTFLTAALTEVASNSACVNVVIPILIALSESLNIHPLYLTLPATVTCSYAFLLPVATPPNAIVFAAGQGDLTISEMFRVMLFPNIICIIVILLCHITYGNLIFNFSNYEYPSALVTSLASNITNITALGVS